MKDITFLDTALRLGVSAPLGPVPGMRAYLLPRERLS